MRLPLPALALLAVLLLPLRSTAQQPVYLPGDDQAKSLLEELRRARDERRWPQALAAFDGLAGGRFEPGLHGRGALAVALDEALLEALAGWPEGAMTAFRAQYEALASRLLARATTPAATWGVVRYFHTEAAARALARLAAQATEQGRAAEALRALELAGRHPDRPIAPAQRLAQQLLLWRMLGREDQVRRLLARAPDTLLLGGRRLAPAEALAQFRPLFTHRPAAPLGPLPGAAQWSVELGPLGLPREIEERLNRGAHPLPPPAFACSDDGRIYAATGDGLACFDAATGALRWRYPELVRRAGPPEHPRSWRCTLHGQAVYGLTRDGLFCLERKTGKLRWRFEPRSQADRKFFERVVALSPPLVAAGRLWVVATRMAGDVESHLLVLDLDGREQQRRLLASTATPRFLGFPYPAPRGTAAGDLLAFQTGQGALVLVDPRTGHPAWGLRYPRLAPRRLEQLVRDGALRRPGPMPVLGSVLFCAPPDSPDCLAIDLIDRRIVWRHPLQRGERLLGAAGDRVLAGGRTLRALAAHDGRVLWQTDAGEPIESLLADARSLALSTRRAMLRVQLAGGKLTDRAAAPFAGRLVRTGGRLALAGRRRLALLADRGAAPAPVPRPAPPDAGARELARLLQPAPQRRGARLAWKSAFPTSLRSRDARFVPLLGAHSAVVPFPIGIADGERVQLRDGASGALLWRGKGPRPLGVATAGELGLVVFTGAALGIDMRSGAVRWAHVPGLGPRDPASLGGWLGANLIAAAAATPDELLLAAGQELLCLEPGSGKLRWRAALPARAVAGGLLWFERAVLVVADDPQRAIALFARRGGTKLASLPRPAAMQRLAGALRLGPTAALGFAGAGRGAERWLGIDPQRGRVVFRVDTPSGSVAVPGSSRHLVLALRNRVTVHDASGRQLWRSRATPREALVAAVAGADLLLAWRDGGLQVERHALDNGARRWHVEDWTSAFPWTVLPDGAGALVLPRRPLRHALRTDGKTLRRSSLPHHHELIHDVRAAGPGVLYLTDTGLVCASSRTAREARDELSRLWPRRDDPLVAPLIARCAAELHGHAPAVRRLARAYEQIASDSLALQLRFIDLAQGHQELATEGRRERVVLRCPRMRTPPEIDGALEEPYDRSRELRMDGLANLRLLVAPDRPWKPWRGTEDLSARLFTGWDKRYFYVAMVVRDRRGTLFHEDGARWIGDSAIFSFDSADSGGFRYDRDKDYAFWVFHPRPRDPKRKRGQPRKGKTSGVPGVKSAIHWSTGGTMRTYEQAIPWALLRRFTPRAGSRFGFNLLLLDDDTGRGATRGMSLVPGNLLDPVRRNFTRRFHPERFARVELVD